MSGLLSVVAVTTTLAEGAWLRRTVYAPVLSSVTARVLRLNTVAAKFEVWLGPIC